jgi:hypothetical protein
VLRFSGVKPNQLPAYTCGLQVLLEKGGDGVLAADLVLVLDHVVALVLEDEILDLFAARLQVLYHAARFCFD